MTFLEFLVGSLACFRLAVLFGDDDGPWGMFRRFRKFLKKEAKEKPAIRKTEIQHGIDCLRCESMWHGGAIAIYVMSEWRSVWVDGLLLALALSAGAILWHRAFPKR